MIEQPLTSVLVDHTLPSQAVSLPAERLPFGKTVQRLFQSYFDVFIDPSENFFLGAKNSANWSLIIMQLLILALVIAGGDLLVNQLRLAVTTQGLRASDLGVTTQGLTASNLGIAFLRQIVNEIFLCVILIGIPFLLAKLLRGTGKLREHISTSLFVLTFMTVILIALSSAGSILSYVFVLYALGLLGASVKTVHNLSTGWTILLVGLGAVVFFVFAVLGFLSLPQVL